MVSPIQYREDQLIYNTDLISLTADIVSAHVSNNIVSPVDVPSLINGVHGALSGLGKEPQAFGEELKPAVSVRSSIKPDYLICLEDGKKLKMLKRYLRTNYNLSPQEYRAKWSLPLDYPMVSPSYAAQRHEMAKRIGLGRKPAEHQLKSVKAAPKARASTKALAAKSTAKSASAKSAAEAPQSKRRGWPKATAST